MNAPGHIEVAANATAAPGEAPASQPLRQVSGYSVPGEGSSTAIAVVTVVSLLLLWWVATHNGWIRDLFLPTPERIITSFGEAWKGDIQGGRPLAEHFGWRSIFFALSGLLLLIALLLVLEMRTNPLAARGGAGRGAIRQSIQRMPRLLLHRQLQVLLATGYAEGVFIFGALAFVAIYLQRRYGIGPGLAGTLVTAYAAGGLVYALLARRALRRFGERGLATLGGLALVIGYGGLAFAASSPLATLCIAGVGVGFYMLHTTVQTHVTHVAPQERGSAVALFATFLFLGQASGVWLAAQVLDAAGLAPVFLGAAAGLALLTALFRYYLSGGT